MRRGRRKGGQDDVRLPSGVGWDFLSFNAGQSARFGSEGRVRGGEKGKGKEVKQWNGKRVLSEGKGKERISEEFEMGGDPGGLMIFGRPTLTQAFFGWTSRIGSGP